LLAPLFALALATTAFAADKTVQFGDLPSAVRETMLKQVAFTGAKSNKTLVEVENGKKNYEWESILANGRKQDFDSILKASLGKSKMRSNPAQFPRRSRPRSTRPSPVAAS
jgi:hypothetical protein